MRSTTYQCDQCNDVLVQGLALEARHFTPEGATARLSLDPALAPYIKVRHFCDIDCLHTFSRRKSGDLTGG